MRRYLDHSQETFVALPLQEIGMHQLQISPRATMPPPPRTAGSAPILGASWYAGLASRPQVFSYFWIRSYRALDSWG